MRKIIFLIFLIFTINYNYVMANNNLLKEEEQSEGTTFEEIMEYLDKNENYSPQKNKKIKVNNSSLSTRMKATQEVSQLADKYVKDLIKDYTKEGIISADLFIKRNTLTRNMSEELTNTYMQQVDALKYAKSIGLEDTLYINNLYKEKIKLQKELYRYSMQAFSNGIINGDEILSYAYNKLGIEKADKLKELDDTIVIKIQEGMIQYEILEGNFLMGLFHSYINKINKLDNLVKKIINIISFNTKEVQFRNDFQEISSYDKKGILGIIEKLIRNIDDILGKIIFLLIVIALNKEKIIKSKEKGLSKEAFIFIFFFIIFPLILGNFSSYSLSPKLIGVLNFLLGLILLFVISIFRFQNMGKSGWNSLLLFVPIYNIYLLFLLNFKEGVIDI